MVYADSRYVWCMSSKLGALEDSPDSWRRPQSRPGSPGISCVKTEKQRLCLTSLARRGICKLPARDYLGSWHKVPFIK